METNIKKIHTVKDLTPSIGLIAVGAGVFFVNKGCGFCIAALGVLLLFLYKSGYRIGDSSKVYHKKSVDLCRGCKEPLKNFLDGKTGTLDIKEGSDGGSFRVDLYYAAKSDDALLQIYDYQGYEYHKDGDLIKVCPEKAHAILQKIK